jgi:hypothetical protein
MKCLTKLHDGMQWYFEGVLLAPPRIVDAKPLPEYGNFFGNAALAKRRERGWFTDKDLEQRPPSQVHFIAMR